MEFKQNEGTAALRWTMFRCIDDDAGDGYAPKTGLMFSSGELKVAKAGEASQNAANFASVVEAGNGYYWYQYSQAELDTFGAVALIVNKTDVYPDATDDRVVATNAYDGAGGGLSRLDATVSSNSPANMATALLDLADGIETGMTPRQALRLLCAIIGGQTEGADTNSEKFLAAVANHKIRATVTLVGSDRSSVAVDLD